MRIDRPASRAAIVAAINRERVASSDSDMPYLLREESQSSPGARATIPGTPSPWPRLVLRRRSQRTMRSRANCSALAAPNRGAAASIPAPSRAFPRCERASGRASEPAHASWYVHSSRDNGGAITCVTRMQTTRVSRAYRARFHGPRRRPAERISPFTRAPSFPRLGAGAAEEGGGGATWVLASGRASSLEEYRRVSPYADGIRSGLSATRGGSSCDGSDRRVARAPWRTAHVPARRQGWRKLPVGSDCQLRRPSSALTHPRAASRFRPAARRAV